MPEDHYPPLNLSPQRQRQKTLETLVAILLELATHQPMLFIVEDLHCKRTSILVSQSTEMVALTMALFAEFWVHGAHDALVSLLACHPPLENPALLLVLHQALEGVGKVRPFGGAETARAVGLAGLGERYPDEEFGVGGNDLAVVRFMVQL